MPYYKIAYSIAFVVILSAIQPVVYANEIGQAVERAVSLLAVVFCADTYLVEVQSKRSEVFCLSFCICSSRSRFENTHPQ